MDFVEKFGLVIHARGKEVWMADEPIIKFYFGLVDEDESKVCQGIIPLSDEEREELNKF